MDDSDNSLLPNMHQANTWNIPSPSGYIRGMSHESQGISINQLYKWLFNTLLSLSEFSIHHKKG